MGKWAHHPFLVSRKCNLGSYKVKYEFLCLPNCSVPLMGRDSLCKLRTQITFNSDSTVALTLRGPEARTLNLMIAQKEEWWLYTSEGRSSEISELPEKIPGMWVEDNPPGLVQNMPLVVAELNLEATPVSQKQYFIPHKAQIRIQNPLDRLLKYGILQPCQSSWNTPLLSVHKPRTKDFRLFQNLWEINSITIYSAPCGPKSIQAFRPCPRCGKIFLLA
jgi:hypothetical protein